LFGHPGVVSLILKRSNESRVMGRNTAVAHAERQNNMQVNTANQPISAYLTVKFWIDGDGTFTTGSHYVQANDLGGNGR
jgi:hypothetical protein